MLNKTPLWKYLIIVLMISLGGLYALPNLYTPDYAVQITAKSHSAPIDTQQLALALSVLEEFELPCIGYELNSHQLLLRFKTAATQSKAHYHLEPRFGDDYVVALSLAETTPHWLTSIGANPLKLGLDLAGGVHFLIAVKTDDALEMKMASLVQEVKRELREAKIPAQVENRTTNIIVSFKDDDLRRLGKRHLATAMKTLQHKTAESNEAYQVMLTLSEEEQKIVRDLAVTKNVATLRNRANELGVSEPLVHRQGADKIVVELPGIQNTAEAKKILGKTATLEFRFAAEIDAPWAEKEKFPFRNDDRGRTHSLLERDVIITGEHVSNAQGSFDENGRPKVHISLQGDGGTLLNYATKKNVGRELGVLLVERKIQTTYDSDFNVVSETPYDDRTIISLATVLEPLFTQFQITGLHDAKQAAELALLLRAGSLAAPIEYIEERTVGPSLGEDNIRAGLWSVQLGLLLVMGFMLLYYRGFGLIANIALCLNLMLLVAAMSLLSATLTLPGIAGIVLTVGMAVDANVLIFARIREELNNGRGPQMAIAAGYERAFVTIMDANLTTFLVAVILYSIGTGPVKGFAVTLAIGILTSMFTAIVCTRALVNLVYGRRHLKKLTI